jgi:hypothetical protein
MDWILQLCKYVIQFAVEGVAMVIQVLEFLKIMKANSNAPPKPLEERLRCPRLQSCVILSLTKVLFLVGTYSP